MADTKQLTILFRLTELIETITPANGFDWDLREKVYRGRSTFGADEEPPFVSILESLRPDPRPQDAGPERLIRSENWELLIQGWCQENRDYPTDDLYRLKGAVEKQVARIVAVDAHNNPQFPEHFRLGGLISGARIGPGIVRAATPQVGGVEAFYLPLLLSYATNLADPFALT